MGHTAKKVGTQQGHVIGQKTHGRYGGTHVDTWATTDQGQREGGGTVLEAWGEGGEGGKGGGGAWSDRKTGCTRHRGKGKVGRVEKGGRGGTERRGVGMQTTKRAGQAREGRGA